MNTQEDSYPLNTEVISACTNGNLDELNYLISAGGDLYQSDNYGNTPLYIHIN